MTLREARQNRKLTQVDLAEKSGVTQANISAIEIAQERGDDMSGASWSTVFRLSRALRYKPEDLFPVEFDPQTAGART